MPRIFTYKQVLPSGYDHFSWLCGDEVKNTYFCWPCLVMGNTQKVRFLVIEIYCKGVDFFMFLSHLS